MRSCDAADATKAAASQMTLARRPSRASTPQVLPGWLRRDLRQLSWTPVAAHRPRPKAALRIWSARRVLFAITRSTLILSENHRRAIYQLTPYVRPTCRIFRSTTNSPRARRCIESSLVIELLWTDEPQPSLHHIISNRSQAIDIEAIAPCLALNACDHDIVSTRQLKSY
jgi:hypothetical protein